METQELFDILPTGIFSNAEELQKFLDDGDVNQLYPLLDKEKFPTLESFQVSLKKKDTPEINTELELEDGLSEQPESAEEKKTPESDLGKIFKSNFLRTVGGISDIPLYINQSVFSAFAPKQQKEYINSLTPEQREIFFETLNTGKASTGTALPMDTDFSRKMYNEANRLRELVDTQYDTGITQDIFSENVGRGLRRLTNEAVGAIPQIVTAFAPGGIVAIGAGTAATKSRRLQEEGADLNFKTQLNSAITGTAEGIFELVTYRMGGQLFKGLREALSSQGKEAVKESLKTILNAYKKGFAREGVSELATEATEDLADLIVLGDEEAFANAFSRYADTFVIGGATGGPIQSFAPGVKRIVQGRQQKILNDNVKKSKYNNVLEPFDVESGNMVVEIDQLPIVQSPNADLFINSTVDNQVKRNEISKTQGEQIKQNFAVAKGIFDQIPTQNLNTQQQKQAADLLFEKLTLENFVAGKDVNLVTKEIQRIESINEQLKNIGLQAQPITSTEQAVEEVEIKDESVEGDTQQRISVAPFFATQIETIDDAESLRQDNKYTEYIAGLNTLINEFGLEGQVEETLGGFQFEDGTTVREISNNIILNNATETQGDEFAALVGALAPEVQEATIAANYTDKQSGDANGVEFILQVDNIQGALETLADVGITDFTLNQSNNSLSLLNLDFMDSEVFQDKLNNLLEKLDEKQIKYSAQDTRPINSRYIDAEARREILRTIQRRSVEQQLEGESLYPKVVQALERIGETVTETTVEETVEPSPASPEQIIETIGDPSMSMEETISVGRAQGFSDIQIQKVLQGRGFKVRDIKPLLELKIEIPAAFRNIAGGINVGQPIFNQVQSELNAFVKKADNVLPGARRAKALEILKANETFQTLSEIDQQQLLLGLDRTLGTTANKVIQQEINQIKNSIADFKKGIKDLKQAQNTVNNFIRKALPNEKEIKGFVSSINKVTSKDDLPAVAEKIIKQIEQQREKQKLSVIKKIKTLANKKARTTKTRSNKIRGGDLTAAGKQFFQAVSEIMNAVTGKNPVNTMVNIANDLSDLAEIERVTNKEIAGEKLSPSESRLLDRVLAFDMFGDIQEKSLEEVQALFTDLQAARAESIRQLNVLREIQARETQELQNELNNQVQKDFPFLYKTDEDGNLVVKNRNDLNQDYLSIRRDFDKLKIWKGLKGVAQTYNFTTARNLFQTIRRYLANLQTVTKILDRYNDQGFFQKYFYNETNIAEENSLRGKFNQQDKISEIASTIEGINNYNDILNLLKEPEIFLNVKGREVEYSADNIARIYALSKNDVQKDKLNKMGYTDSVLNDIKNNLDNKVIEFIDKLIDYLSTDYYEGVNDVYSKINNINLPQIRNYFPTRTISQAEFSSDLLAAGDFSAIFNAETAPALKAREDLISPIDLGRGLTFTNTLYNHIETLEKYKAFASTVKKLNTIMKLDGVGALMNETGTSRLVRNSVNAIVNPGYGIDQVDTGLFAKALNNFTGYALSFRLMQIPKQASSFVNAFEQYRFNKSGKPNFVKDLFGFAIDMAQVISNLPKEIKETRDISASFRDRLEKGFGGDLYGLETGGTLGLKKSPALRRYRAAAASPTVLGDLLGIMGYKIVYNRNIKNGMSPQEALRIFNDYNATQQSRRGADKIELQRSRDALTRTFTMFMSTTYLQMNQTAQGVSSITTDLIKGKKPKAADIRRVALNAYIANAMFVFMANSAKFFLGDNEDKEEVFNRLKFSNTVLNLVYAIPLLGSAVEVMNNRIQGKRFSEDSIVNPYSAVVSRMYQLISKEGGFSLRSLTPIFELIAGTRFDPFAGLFNIFKDLKITEESFLDLIGTTSYYRPDKDEVSKPVSNKASGDFVDPELQQQIKDLKSQVRDIKKEVRDALQE